MTEEQKKEYQKSYPKKWWNPKLTDFLEVNSDKTLIGFAWSCQWRLSIVITAVYAVFAILLIMLGEI